MSQVSVQCDYLQQGRVIELFTTWDSQTREDYTEISIEQAVQSPFLYSFFFHFHHPLICLYSVRRQRVLVWKLAYKPFRLLTH